jgi:HEAT repeat protein
MTSKMKHSGSTLPRPPMLSRYVGFSTFANISTAGEAVVRIDREGRVLENRSAAALPYYLGNLAALVVEPLPAEPQLTWTTSGAPSGAAASPFPFARGGPAAFVESGPVQKSIYAVEEESDGLIVIAKRSQVTLAAAPGRRSQADVIGDGKLTFDTGRGVFSGLDFDARATVRDMGRTEDVALRLTYRLLDEHEAAESAREAEKAQEAAEEARKEKDRALTVKEIEVAVADLNSSDQKRAGAAARLLADRKPQEPNAKVAQALEAVMLGAERGDGCRSEAASALKNWSTPESVPGLMKALADDWPPVRSHALEALCKYAPPKAIKPAAQFLTQSHTQGAAAKFLKAVGPDAEDAVLAVFAASKDAWVCAEICGILDVIGTKKCVPALEKAVLDDNWMVNGSARKALAAVKGRVDASSEK